MKSNVWYNLASFALYFLMAICLIALHYSTKSWDIIFWSVLFTFNLWTLIRKSKAEANYASQEQGERT